jgi:hypothetical protein
VVLVNLKKFSDQIYLDIIYNCLKFISKET